MTVPSPNDIKDQINRLIACLVETGLSNDENFAFLRQRISGFVEITFSGAEQAPVAMKDRAYDQVHRHLLEAGAYNMRMLDGALIQMIYEFSSGVLRRHRLAFFPAPQLEEFQNNPEVYLDDEVYADVIAKSIVPFPVRFDYDIRAIHDRKLNVSRFRGRLISAVYVGLDCHTPSGRGEQDFRRPNVNGHRICCGPDYVADSPYHPATHENTPYLSNIISFTQSAARKAISPVFALHGRSDPGSAASQSAMALAFISMSISA